ncbi:DUF551 domain-containing protein [Klebsiella quasipneumoniae]|uniref:DUF551 domain-containing protein n=1 Tax=Klebsiella quasipneumoniae TaxID=1463165 RepID=UPI003890C7D6
MTKSTITRERLLEIIVTGPEASGAEQNELARMALGAMDSEPVAEVVSIYGDPEAFGEREIRPLVGIQQMPYGTKLYRHAQPAPEMKPVGYLFVSEQGSVAYSPTNWGMPGFRLVGQIYGDIDVESQPAPVVPQDVLEALQKVARIRLDMNDFDGDRRGIADCLCDAEEALIEVVNRRAAMLAAAPQSPGSEPATVPGKWIPVSVRMPIEFEAVIAFDGDQVYGEAMYSSDDGFTIDGYEPCDRLNLQNVTHWMPLPAAPQEVKGD